MFIYPLPEKDEQLWIHKAPNNTYMYRLNFIISL